MNPETVEKAREIQRLRENGLSLRQIAKVMKCALATVQRLLGVPVHPAEAEILMGEFPKLSSRAIAKMCGVSDMFVGSIRTNVGANELHLSTTGSDGKTYRSDPKPAGRWPTAVPEPEEAGGSAEGVLVGPAHQEVAIEHAEPQVTHVAPAVVAAAAEPEVHVAEIEVKTREDEPIKPKSNAPAECRRCACRLLDPLVVEGFGGRPMRKWRCVSCGHVNGATAGWFSQAR